MSARDIVVTTEFDDQGGGTAIATFGLTSARVRFGDPRPKGGVSTAGTAMLFARKMVETYLAASAERAGT